MSEGLTVEGLGVCTTLCGGDSETECIDLAAAGAEEAPTELGVALLLQITLNSSCRCTRVGVPYYPELVHGQLQRPAARLAG